MRISCYKIAICLAVYDVVVSFRTAVLSERLDRGDSNDSIFNEHRQLFFGIAYRMLGSASDAEDIVRDCYMTFDAAGGKISGIYLVSMQTNCRSCGEVTDATRIDEELD